MQVPDQSQKTPHQNQESKVFARYTFHIPAHTNEGNSLNHLVPALRKLLTQSGMHGRTLIRGAEADWGEKSHGIHLLIVDAEDHSKNDQLVKDVGKQIKEIAEAEGLYISKHPITYFLI